LTSHAKRAEVAGVSIGGGHSEGLDRLLPHSTTVNIKGERYRLKAKEKAGLVGTAGSEEHKAENAGWEPEDGHDAGA